LAEWDSYNSQFVILDNVTVEDEPHYIHRGFSLDTSRNFYSVEEIKLLIDSLSYSKMNVFHWHITDSQSFPLELESYPEFTSYGAYSADMVYTKAQVLDLVSYAADRGVVIIPEIDAPAHVGAGWQAVDASMTLCVDAEPWTSFCVQPPCGQLNPVNMEMYDVLEAIHKEILEMFQPQMLHMGGDEVHFGCWGSSAEIQQWLVDHQKEVSDEGLMYLWSHFQNESYKRVDGQSWQLGLGTPSITLWSSHLTLPPYIDYLDTDIYAIQIWADSTDCTDKTIKTAAERGHKMIFSNVDGTYLDCGFAGWVTNGNNWCSPYKGWQLVYENDPVKILKYHDVSNLEEAIMNVLGGEVAMWSEQTDGMNLMAKAEPRASAFAERLWRGSDTGTWWEAEPRMVRHRERLRQRGIAAEAVTQRWCNQNEGRCLLPPPDAKEPETCTGTGDEIENGGGRLDISGFIALVCFLVANVLTCNN